MSKKLCLILLLLLTSCGFRPLYKVETENGIIQNELASIKIESKKGRQGQQLVNSLDSAFNPTGMDLPKTYLLAVSTEETYTAVAVQNNNEITRYNVVMEISYNMKSIDSGNEVTKGKFRMFGSYDAVPSSNFATLVGKQNSINNVVNEVSRELKRRIVVSLKKI